MTHLSTHVLDAVSGAAASDVRVVLSDAAGTLLAEASTDPDGRVSSLAPQHLATGIYRLRFDTAAYFAARHLTGFYPEVVIAFEITDSDGRYHVPLLLSPFAYSTYRGS